MSDVIWKRFSLDELFEFNSGNQLSLNKKALDVSEQKNDEYCIALITQSEKNNGISGYLKLDDEIASKKMKGFMTYSMHFGLCFYHNYDFVLMDTHGSVFKLIAKNDRLADLVNGNIELNVFLSSIITHVCKNGIYNYSWLPNSTRVGREYILLPCLEVSSQEESIWEEDGKFYTLAVDYIKQLMEEAKELKEQKTIRLYEAERAKYEAERAKYEAERAKYEAVYNEEKKSVIWKRFSLDELFEFNSGNQLPYTRKELDVSEIKDETYNIAVVAQSERNNGVTCYVDGNTIDKAKIMKNYMIYSLNFGTCFYQQNDFVLLDTHGSIFRLVAKDNGLEEILRNDYIIGNFFSKSIMKICKNGVYNYNWKPNAQRASSEVILLPCLEVSSQEESIWEEDGKFYTLAVNYISYLYLSGKVNQNQKLIDNYTYQY